MGVSAKLPDALTGGSVVGQLGGVSIITNGQSLTRVTGNWLAAHSDEIDECYVFGGIASVTPGTKAQIENALK